jgi:hypothetical protein
MGVRGDMKIIHLGTKVETILGVMDDEGNVLNTIPVQVSVNRLGAEQFLEALGLMEARKDELTVELEEAGKPAAGEAEAQV